MILQKMQLEEKSLSSVREANSLCAVTDLSSRWLAISMPLIVVLVQEVEY